MRRQSAREQAPGATRAWRRARAFQDREGEKSAIWGLGRRVLDQEREKKMRGDPGSGEPGIFGGQPVEAQDRISIV